MHIAQTQPTYARQQKVATVSSQHTYKCATKQSPGVGQFTPNLSSPVTL